jgi:hypothetical protein
MIRKDMNMNYGETLSKAWKIIWKNKILWLFGILAGCSAAIGGSGSGGSSGGGGSSSGGGSSLVPGSEQAVRNISHFANNTGNFVEQNPWIWIIVGLAIFGLILLLIAAALFLGALGTSGVIKGTLMADDAEEGSKPLSFKSIFKGLKPYYWRMLLFELVVIAAKMVLGILIAGLILAFIIFTLGIGILLLLPMILLIIPISLFIYLIIINSLIAIVVEDKPIFKAIASAWQVTTSNLGPMIVMGIILVLGQFIATLLIIAPVFLSFVPVGLSFILMEQPFFIIAIVMSGLLALGMIILAICLSGVIRAYVLSAWTMNYRKCLSLMNAKIFLGNISEDKEIEASS